MKILDLFVYLIQNISKSEFMIVIFAILVIIAIFGFIDKRLK